MDYTSSKAKRKEHKGILATCGIWKDVPQQNGKFIGTGSLIKDFFPNCDKKTHLVTSDKVISPDALRFYYLYFKKSKDKEEEPKKLVDMVSGNVILKSGLAIVPVDPNKLNFKKKRHPSTICAKVRKDLRNDELYCHVFECFGRPFTITPYQVNGIADKETYIADDISGKMESSRFYKDYRKGLGAPITITVDEEAVVVGAITLDNNNKISFVLFSEIDRTRISSDSSTSLTSSSSKDARQRETFEQSVDQDTPAQGNMSLNSLGNSCYEVSIEPAKTPLKGREPCWLTFNRNLPSDITSGSAKFCGLGSIDLHGVKHKTNSLVGRRIPRAYKEGWVTVKVNGKSDKTGKSSYLGETEIFYFNEYKEDLKQIVQNQELLVDLFETWKTTCEEYSIDSIGKQTKSFSSGRMNSGNSLHSLQGLRLLVYAAAEVDARQFIKLVFNSSARKVVFNAYRCTLPLPEDVARVFGHEDTAKYLESISKRLSEDLSADEECLKVLHILELAEAVKNQSNSGTSMTSSSSKDARQRETFEHSVDQETPAQDSSTSLTSSSSKDARQRETFEQSVDQDTPAQDGGTSMKSSSSKDARQRETFKHSVGQDTPVQDGGTSMTSSSSKNARQRKTFKHSVDQETSAQGNMSLNLLGKSCYEVSIMPSQASLKGGGPCWFTFEPDLPSGITSGTAKFADLSFVDLIGVKHKTNSLAGAGIPPAEEAGWVTVEVHGSDETGKSSYLGQTTFLYFDEREKVFELIIHNKEQHCSFFETWNAACKGHLTDSREKETKSSSSGRT